MNRRDFIAQTVSIAALAGAGIPKPTWADPLGLPIGIQLYTVRDDMLKDAPGTVAKVAQIGYKEVEAVGFGSMSTAPALRKVLDDNGLKCPSAHLIFGRKYLSKACDDAHALGCTYATAVVPRLLIMDLPAIWDAPAAGRQAVIQKIVAATSAPLTKDDLQKIIDAMNQVGAAAKQQGLLFGAHNHTAEFEPIDGRPALYHMIEQTDPASVKFEIDCGWAEVAGYSPVDIGAKYPGRIKMLHIKDFLPFEKGATAAGPNSPKGSELGRGVIDYKTIFAGMKDKGIEHIFVEQEGPFSRMPAIQSAEVDYKFLHSIA
jgi:sugar phosphate isomerase/epimerase